MDLHNKYRPKKFEDVIGQDDVIYSLERVLDEGSSHAFLFVGPSGVGKTTLARIIADMVGTESLGLHEIDAATYTGIDAMREVTATARIRPIGRSGIRTFIIDECQALSKAAWQSMLKDLEEPRDNVYWILCTTDESKVLDTVRTRCIRHKLNKLDPDKILEFIKDIAAKEKIELDDEILRVIAKKSDGSPRRALVDLAACSDCRNPTEARRILEELDENKQVIDLCRWLISGKKRNWKVAMELMGPLIEQGMNAEAIRIVIVAYMQKALINAENDKQATHLLRILEQFQETCKQTDNLAPILIGVGNLVYGAGHE